MQIIRPPDDDGMRVVCLVDRRTLAPQEYRLLDPTGRVRFTLQLEDYFLFEGGIAWPRRLTAVSDEGRIVVEMRQVELNQELAPAAFKPPRKAEKQP